MALATERLACLNILRVASLRYQGGEEERCSLLGKPPYGNGVPRPRKFNTKRWGRGGNAATFDVWGELRRDVEAECKVLSIADQNLK